MGHSWEHTHRHFTEGLVWYRIGQVEKGDTKCKAIQQMGNTLEVNSCPLWRLVSSMLCTLKTLCVCVCVCVCVFSPVVPNCLWPQNCNPPGYSVHGVFQARILEWVATSFSGDLSYPVIEPGSPALQADSLPLCHLRSSTFRPGHRNHYFHLRLVKKLGYLTAYLPNFQACF